MNLHLSHKTDNTKVELTTLVSCWSLINLRIYWACAIIYLHCMNFTFQCWCMMHDDGWIIVYWTCSPINTICICHYFSFFPLVFCTAWYDVKQALREMLSHKYWVVYSIHFMLFDTMLMCIYSKYLINGSHYAIISCPLREHYYTLKLKCKLH